MFNKGETVLVLGAGASVHYGYPLGESLVLEIVNELTQNEGEYGPDGLRLKAALQAYDPINIDFFLSHHLSGTWQTLGKQLIVKVLLKKENKNHLNLDPLDWQQIGRHQFLGKATKDNWYRFLWYSIVSGATPKQLLDGEHLNLKIITFNYDVSLEYFLFSRVTSKDTGLTIFKEPDEQSAILNMLSQRIIHVHGCLSPYEWQEKSGRSSDDYGEFGSSVHTEQRWKVSNYANNIRIIDQTNIVHPDIEKARTWLEKANYIFFLGYGFDPNNNKLLDLKRYCQKADLIFYTNFSNLKKIENCVENLFGKKGFRENNIPIRPRGEDLIKSTSTVYEALSSDFTLAGE